MKKNAGVFAASICQASHIKACYSFNYGLFDFCIINRVSKTNVSYNCLIQMFYTMYETSALYKYLKRAIQGDNYGRCE
jgi:hypothetical protein